MADGTMLLFDLSTATGATVVLAFLMIMVASWGYFVEEDHRYKARFRTEDHSN